MLRLIRNMRMTIQVIILRMTIHIIIRTAIITASLTAIPGSGGHHLASIFAPSIRSDFARFTTSSITSRALTAGMGMGMTGTADTGGMMGMEASTPLDLASLATTTAPTDS